jgi:WD40 repeat protein
LLKNNDMGMVFGVAFLPDGKRALSAGEDRQLRVWDVEKGSELLSFGDHDEAITGLAVTPDGRIAVSGSEDATVRLWDLATGEELKKLEFPQSVAGLAISPGGQLFAACGLDGVLQVWELPSGRLIRSVRLRLTMLSGIAFAPDARHFALASRHGTTMVVRLQR